MTLRAMPIALLAEGPRVRVEASVDALQGMLLHAELAEATAQRRGIRCLHGAEASVAAAVIGWTERAAAGMGHRPHAGGAVRHHHADIAPELALDADAVMRNHRLPLRQKRGDQLHELALVDRAAPQLEIDRHVLGDRGG